MAKIERIINKDFDQLLSTIEDGIINGSVSASLEDASDFPSLMSFSRVFCLCLLRL